MSNITNDVTELQKLDNQIKVLNKELKLLRQAKTECEARVLDYCVSSGQPGVSFNNFTVYVETKQKSIPSKKDEKVSKLETVLHKHGIVNSKEAISEVMNALKGDAESKMTLKIIGN